MSTSGYRVRPVVEIEVEFQSTTQMIEFWDWLWDGGIPTYGSGRGIGRVDARSYDIADAEKVVEWLKAHGLEPRQ